MRTLTLLIFTTLLSTYSCTSDRLNSPSDNELQKVLRQTSPTGNSDYYILPQSDDYSSIHQDPRNPLNEGKVELGKMLFFETGLALSPQYEFSEGFYSCATCHLPDRGFMPARVQGIADGGIGFGEDRDRTILYEEDEIDVQGARPLSLINISFSTNTSWSGMFGGNDVNADTESIWGNIEATEINYLGYYGLESQSIESLHLHRQVVNETVIDELNYREAFDACFPNFEEEERYSSETAALAIAAYLRTLSPTEAPFQQWLKGEEDAMSTEEKEGAKLFFGKAGCFRCHSSPALNNPDNFYAIGVKDLYETGEAYNTDANDFRNFGRGFFTENEADMFKFKVPQLYNMGTTPFFFHGSSKNSMREVIEYFNQGIPENSRVPAENIAAQFHPLNLTTEEIDNLTLFMENSLYDQNMSRYAPERILSGQCFPNNDPASKVQLGCEN